MAEVMFKMWQQEYNKLPVTKYKRQSYDRSSDRLHEGK